MLTARLHRYIYAPSRAVPPPPKHTPSPPPLTHVPLPHTTPLYCNTGIQLKVIARCEVSKGGGRRGEGISRSFPWFSQSVSSTIMAAICFSTCRLLPCRLGSPMTEQRRAQPALSLIVFPRLPTSGCSSESAALPDTGTLTYTEWRKRSSAPCPQARCPDPLGSGLGLGLGLGSGSGLGSGVGLGGQWYGPKTPKIYITCAEKPQRVIPGLRETI